MECSIIKMGHGNPSSSRIQKPATGRFFIWSRNTITRTSSNSYMRSLWTGSLSFGLINIPVKLYSASMERALSFKLFDKHGNCPVSYMKVCRANGKEVKQEDIVK